MHRSGTSVVTGLIEKMGFFLGEKTDLLGPNDDNKKGFFENTNVISQNILLLKGQNCNWHLGLSQYNPNNIKEQDLKEFKSSAGMIIKELFDKKPYAIKDPRCCLTMDHWKLVSKKPILVFVNRNPTDIANSLAKRNKFSVEFGLALWEKYVKTALKSSVGCETIFVSFHKFLDNPTEETKNLFEKLHSLGVEKIKLPKESEIRDFVDISLSSSLNDFDISGLDKDQLELFRIMEGEVKLDYEKFNFELSAKSLEILKK